MAASVHSIEYWEDVGANSPLSLTVPSGISAVYVFWSYYTSTDNSGMASATLASAAPDASHEVDTKTNSTASGVLAWYGVAAGAQSLAYTKDAAAERGPKITVVYVTGGNAWRDVDAANAASTTAVSVTIDTESDDLVIKSDYSTNAAGSGVSSGWTLLNHLNAGLSQQTISTCDAPGATSTVCAAENESYSSLVAVSIPELQYISASEIGLESAVDGYNQSGQIPQGLGVQSAIDAESDYVFNNFKIGFNSSADTSGNVLQSAVAGGIGIKGSADSYLATERFTLNIGLKGVSDADYQTKHVEEIVGFNSLVSSNREFTRDGEEHAGLNSAIDAYNFTAWAAANLPRARKIYTLTLTGGPDGVADIELPFSSFIARKRSDSPTYLSAVIRKFDYAGQIAARSNGEIVVDAVYLTGVVETLRQEVARVPLDTITTDEGPRSRSITLSGYKTVTYHQRSVTLQGAIYKRLSSGKLQYRFADIDIFLNPEDELTVGDDTFQVGSLTYYVSGNTRQMDVFQVEQ